MSQVPPGPGWSPQRTAWNAPPAPPPGGWGTARVVAFASCAALLLMLAVGAGVYLTVGPEVARALFHDATQQHATWVDKDELRAGDCLDDHALLGLAPGEDIDSPGDAVEVVPCAGRHDFEVATSFYLADHHYADQRAIRRAAERECFRRIGRDWARDRRLLRDKVLAYYMPLHTSPRRDKVVCLFQLASGEPMTGAIR